MVWSFTWSTHRTIHFARKFNRRFVLTLSAKRTAIITGRCFSWNERPHILPAWWSARSFLPCRESSSKPVFSRALDWPWKSSSVASEVSKFKTNWLLHMGVNERYDLRGESWNTWRIIKNSPNKLRTRRAPFIPARRSDRKKREATLKIWWQTEKEWNVQYVNYVN